MARFYTRLFLAIPGGKDNSSTHEQEKEEELFFARLREDIANGYVGKEDLLSEGGALFEDRFNRSAATAINTKEPSKKASRSHTKDTTMPSRSKTIKNTSTIDLTSLAESSDSVPEFEAQKKVLLKELIRPQI